MFGGVKNCCTFAYPFTVRGVNNNKLNLFIMENLTIEQAWDTLINLGVTEQTLKIVTSINGYNMDAMTDILYAYTGYRNFEQPDDEEE